MAHVIVPILILLAGTVLFLLGSALAWGRSALIGYSIGGAGTILLVLGAILFRQAMVGRYLAGEGEDEVQP